MLVLTRKRNETILIGDEIVVTVIHTSQGSVKLGIQAPPHVRVLRGEVAFETPQPAAGAANTETVVELSADEFLAEFNSLFTGEDRGDQFPAACLAGELVGAAS